MKHDNSSGHGDFNLSIVVIHTVVFHAVLCGIHTVETVSTGKFSHGTYAKPLGRSTQRQSHEVYNT